MDENYIAYINMGKKGVQSLLLASFDADKLSNDDQAVLVDCFSNNNCTGWLDSLKPEHVYIGLDFNGKPVIMVDQTYNDEEPWFVDVINIYPTYEYALKAFLKEAKFKGNDYKKAVMKLIWK